MKNEFNLKYSMKFYNDLDNIISYIKYELNNIIAADNLLKKVEEEIQRRLENPIGYEKYETKSKNIYYRIYIKNYILFYTVENNVMIIRRFIYRKRNMEEIL